MVFPLEPPSRTEKLAKLQDFLENIIGTQSGCAICWFTRCTYSSDRHNTLQCPSNLCSLTMPGYIAFKIAIHFEPRTVCYYCCYPYQSTSYLDLFIHQKKDCLYPDILKPLAWLIWNDASTRERLKKQGKLQGESLEDYAQWLGLNVDRLPNVIHVLLGCLELRQLHMGTFFVVLS